MKALFITIVSVVSFTQISFAQEEKNNIEQSPVLEKLIELKKKMGPNENMDKIFTIQVFSGKRENADITLKDLKTKHPDWACDMQHEWSNYKIRIGKFRSRLEADKHLIEVKTEYPHAFVITPTK